MNHFENISPRQRDGLEKLAQLEDEEMARQGHVTIEEARILKEYLAKNGIKGTTESPMDAFR